MFGGWWLCRCSVEERGRRWLVGVAMPERDQATRLGRREENAMVSVFRRLVCEVLAADVFEVNNNPRPTHSSKPIQQPRTPHSSPPPPPYSASPPRSEKQQETSTAIINLYEDIIASDAQTIHVQQQTLTSQQDIIRSQAQMIVKLRHLLEEQDRRIEDLDEVARGMRVRRPDAVPRSRSS
jgi:hypothetical protein